MFARVTIAEGDSSRMDEGIQNITERVIPRAKELPGFQGGYWIADRGSGKVFGITLWDTEAHLRETEDAAAQLRSQSAEQMNVQFTVYSGEVVAKA
jgi:hypothetical protein